MSIVLNYILLMYLVLEYFESIHSISIFGDCKNSYKLLLIDVFPGDSRKVYIIDRGSAKKLAIPYAEPNYAWRYCKTESHIARIFKFPSRIPSKS